MQPLEIPALSHSHPPGTNQRSLGKLANDQPFGSRNLNILTPFKYVSVGESVKDLPVIGDGMTGHCISFPDHILKETATENIRRQIQAIPLFPRGSSFAKAWCNEATRTMSKEERLFFPADKTDEGKPRDCVQATSKGWQRAHPDELINTVRIHPIISRNKCFVQNSQSDVKKLFSKRFPINELIPFDKQITVSPQYHNSRGGSTIHWNEHRGISLMEYRQGQTYPDDEILVGSRAKGIKIIGNSVARSVAVSFGLRLREAWLITKPENSTTTTGATNSNLLPTKTPLPLSHPSRPLPSSSKAKPIEIPDSTETSDDEGYKNHISAPKHQKSVFPEQRLPTLSVKIPDRLVEQARSMKRPRSISQNVQTPQGRVSKASRLSAQLTSTPQVIIHSGITSASRTAKLPPKSPAKVVIDLTSDSEDDILIAKELQAPKTPAVPYNAVDNSLFNAYAQTNTFMNYDVQRKHGPIRR